MLFYRGKHVLLYSPAHALEESRHSQPRRTYPCGNMLPVHEKLEEIHGIRRMRLVDRILEPYLSAWDGRDAACRNGPGCIERWRRTILSQATGFNLRDSMDIDSSKFHFCLVSEKRLVCCRRNGTGTDDACCHRVAGFMKE